MAEWSGAPPLPPREPGGAGDRFPLPPQQFLRFLAIPWSNVQYGIYTTNPPVDCQWSNWSILQECSRTCGGGTSRSKTLDSGPDIRLKNNQN